MLSDWTPVGFQAKECFTNLEWDPTVLRRCCQNESEASPGLPPGVTHLAITLEFISPKCVDGKKAHFLEMRRFASRVSFERCRDCKWNDILIPYCLNKRGNLQQNARKSYLLLYLLAVGALSPSKYCSIRDILFQRGTKGQK